MTRVHVWGASGYAAAEAVRLLHRHPYVEVGVLESRSHAGDLVADHFPRLRSLPYRFAGAGAIAATLQPGDVVLTAGSHGEAREIVPAFLSAGARAIDLSAGYRFDRRAAYGLSEWHRTAIAAADLVANPGCYPTAALLALLPLAGAEGVAAIAIDAKSGISGAGRTPQLGTLFAEVSGDVRAYGLAGHRHQPEIEQGLRGAGILAPATFTPHVVPIVRGMLVNAYVFFDAPVNAAEIAARYDRAYASSPFVRVLAGERAPSVLAVCGTNDAELHVTVNGRMVRAICAIDNLGKGAAGQAVQNLNIMLGFPQEAGLGARTLVA